MHTSYSILSSVYAQQAKPINNQTVQIEVKHFSNMGFKIGVGTMCRDRQAASISNFCSEFYIIDIMSNVVETPAYHAKLR
jgi:hypothetical protein